MKHLKSCTATLAKRKVNKLENACNFQATFSDDNVIYLGKLTTEEEPLDFSMLELHGGR